MKKKILQVVQFFLFSLPVGLMFFRDGCKIARF